ncbi:MAG: hypothetical protein V4635_16095 [Bacteroidota bacterium]
MKNKVLEALRISLQPYLFFWEEWSRDDNCNLTVEEVQLVNNYLASSFKIGMFESFLFYNKVKAVKEVIRKLNLGYQIFKDFVIVNFLFKIISIAKEYGYKKFLETPVHQLEVPEQMKTILMSFKAYTLQQFFIIYKVEDFGRNPVFRKIVTFQAYVKEEAMISQ